jgi:hypothetical protein
MTIPFVSETAIDKIADQLNQNPANFDQAIADMQVNQPILFSYLLSESFKLLTKDESEYLLYLSLVIWKSIHQGHQKLEKLDSAKIEEIEEKNWALLNESKARKFRDKLDAFFEKYPQEDLLAYVEDALVDDEDSFVTKEGRELLFIGLKTTIDALCGID